MGTGDWVLSTQYPVPSTQYSVPNTQYPIIYLRGRMLKEETIVALSTAPGIGAIALVRMTGPDSERIAQAIFGKDMRSALSGKAIHGWVMDGEQRVDEPADVRVRLPVAGHALQRVALDFRAPPVEQLAERGP